jgi:hypothetical protein
MKIYYNQKLTQWQAEHEYISLSLKMETINENDFQIETYKSQLKDCERHIKKYQSALSKI